MVSDNNAGISFIYIILYQRKWDINYGADGQLNGENIKPGVNGWFYVVFNPATGLCQLEPL